MEQKETKPPTEAELKRLLALDRAAVEERLAKSKSNGRKIGALIAVAIALAVAITVLVAFGINQK